MVNKKLLLLAISLANLNNMNQANDNLQQVEIINQQVEAHELNLNNRYHREVIREPVIYPVNEQQLMYNLDRRGIR